MRKRILIPLMIILVLVVTFSSSVAFFSLLENGTTENTVVVMDGMKFIYKELDNNGNGINLNDAYPISDNEGKSLDTYFDFRIESRLKDDSVTYNVIINTTQSTIPDNNIKVYLTEVNGNTETEINNVINKLSEYEQSEKGRIIYSETIDKDLVSNYTKNFRLRLWLSDDISDYDSLVGTTGIYTVDVNSSGGITPTTPVLAINASNNWTNTVPTINLVTNGTSPSGVDHYEVYDTNTSTLPDENTVATATTQDEYQVTTEGTHYIYYRTVANDGLKSEWSEPEAIDLETRLVPNYGTSISSSISDIYYTSDGNSYSRINDSSNANTDGNYIPILPSTISNTQIANAPNGTGRYSIVVQGDNIFTLTENSTNSWIKLVYYAAGGTSAQTYLGNIKLIFADGANYTIQQAVANNYIEPLVIYYSDENSWKNMANTLTGGNTTSVSYPVGYHHIKVKNKSNLTQISFTTNTNWRTTYDGFKILKYSENFDMSISPFTTQYRYFMRKKTVTFNTNGGDISETSRKVDVGTTIGTLPTPTKTGKTFLGWYTDTNYATKVDSNYVVEDDITLYALWGTEVNLNIENRTQGYPSDTAFASTTKRSYTNNTYVSGLAFDNSYSSLTVTNNSLAANTISMNSGAGYGIGLPVSLENGSYIISTDIAISSSNYILLSIIKYTSDGSSTYAYGIRLGSGNLTYGFNIDSSTSYQVIDFSNNGSNINITFSNIHLYKLD